MEVIPTKLCRAQFLLGVFPWTKDGGSNPHIGASHLNLQEEVGTCSRVRLRWHCNWHCRKPRIWTQHPCSGKLLTSDDQPPLQQMRKQNLRWNHMMLQKRERKERVPHFQSHLTCPLKAHIHVLVCQAPYIPSPYSWQVSASRTVLCLEVNFIGFRHKYPQLLEGKSTDKLLKSPPWYPDPWTPHPLSSKSQFQTPNSETLEQALPENFQVWMCNQACQWS